MLDLPGFFPIWQAQSRQSPVRPLWKESLYSLLVKVAKGVCSSSVCWNNLRVVVQFLSEVVSWLLNLWRLWVLCLFCWLCLNPPATEAFGELFWDLAGGIDPSERTVPTDRFLHRLHGFKVFFLPLHFESAGFLLIGISHKSWWTMNHDMCLWPTYHELQQNIPSMPGLYQHPTPPLKPRVVVSTGTGMVAISLLAGFSLRSSSRMSRSMIGYLYSYMFLGFIGSVFWRSS